ncbi:unnamed protein product [Schistosoma spindalis]|nr:unnamed protein product [Schistosoma spindale]
MFNIISPYIVVYICWSGWPEAQEIVTRSRSPININRFLLSSSKGNNFSIHISGLANEAAARSRPMEKRGEIDNTKSKILDNYKKNGVRLNDILNFAKAFIP